MLVDWFTVAAQALNFIVLVWLLKRFLYGPILHAVDAREKRIAAALADADAKRSEAKRERDEFGRKIEAFDAQRAVMLRKATDEVEAERQRLLGAVRKEADASSARRMEALRSDAQNLDRTLRRRVQEEVFSIARKALADLASTNLEQRMAEVFAQRLRALDAPSKAAFAAALQPSGTALVRTAFDMPAESRTAVQTALREAFSAQLDVRFETAPELVSGIEVSANGQKVAWSIRDYLTSLERSAGEILDAEVEPAAIAPNVIRRADERSA